MSASMPAWCWRTACSAVPAACSPMSRPRGPRSTARPSSRPTRVRRGATIGANATIVCGHDLGAWCLIAAGAVSPTTCPLGPDGRRSGPADRLGQPRRRGAGRGPGLPAHRRPLRRTSPMGGLRRVINLSGFGDDEPDPPVKNSQRASDEAGPGHRIGRQYRQAPGGAPARPGLGGAVRRHQAGLAQGLPAGRHQPAGRPDADPALEARRDLRPGRRGQPGDLRAGLQPGGQHQSGRAEQRDPAGPGRRRQAGLFLDLGGLRSRPTGRWTRSPRFRGPTTAMA
jgi:hypothetical protein